MTTFDEPAALSTADATIARLRSGTPLTPTEQAGLTKLLDTVRQCLPIAEQPASTAPSPRREKP